MTGPAWLAWLLPAVPLAGGASLAVAGMRANRVAPAAGAGTAAVTLALACAAAALRPAGSAPLLAGNDLTKMSEADRNILMNKEAIAIDQDSLGKQGDRLYESGDLDVWTKPLSGGRVAVGLFNRSWSTRDVSVDLSEIGFKGGGSVRDVWKQTDLGRRSGVFTSRIPKHGVTLLVVGK